jgi:hypothetical protein
LWQPAEQGTVDRRGIVGYCTTLLVAMMNGASTPVAAESTFRLAMWAPGDEA